MKKNRPLRNVPLVFFILLGGAMFIYAGYIFSAAMQPIDEGLAFLQRVVIALGQNFSENCNQFTPIVMVFAFVLYEFILFLLLVIHHKKGPTEEKRDESLMTDTNVQELEERVIEQVREDPPVQQTEEEDAAIDENVFRELYSYNYSVEQITEMMRLSNHVKGIDTNLYIKIFDICMSPEQIRQYIDMFYG